MNHPEYVVPWNVLSFVSLYIQMLKKRGFQNATDGEKRFIASLVSFMSQLVRLHVVR